MPNSTPTHSRGKLHENYIGLYSTIYQPFLSLSLDITLFLVDIANGEPGNTTYSPA